MGLTAGSLFTGVGGFDMGVEAAGFRTVWQVEWDKHCQGVLARHWPDVQRWGDVSGVDGAIVPPVDLVTFGSPCQDLSVAGKRAGLDGARSGLFHEAIRIIREMRDATDAAFPRVAIWENVAGALSSNGGADFAAVIGALADLGAHLVEWHLLDAQWFGVPQRRRRVFVVAVFDPSVAAGCPDPLLPVGARSGGHPAKGKPSGQDVAGTLGGGSGSPGWCDDLDRTTFIPVAGMMPTIAPTVTAKWAKGSGGPAGDECQNMIAVPIQGTLIGRSEHAGPGGIGVGEPGAPMFTLTSTDRHAVASVPYVKVVRAGARDDDGELPPEVWREEQTAPTLNVFDNGSEARATVLAMSQNQRGEVVLSEHAHAVTAGGGKPGEGYPAALVGSAVRRLTPLECERLMGWPDDHTRWRADGTEQADSQRYRQCGNGVASPVAAWIAHHIHQAIQETQ